MKRKDFFYFTAMALLTASMLILGGCPEELGENKVDSGLVGNWSNEETGNDLKTFTINSDGSFSARLSPEGADGEGTVTGVLIKEESEYVMNNMTETTGRDWGSLVSFYNDTNVQITLSNNNNTFVLRCADKPIVDDYFGGTYYRQ